MERDKIGRVFTIILQAGASSPLLVLPTEIMKNARFASILGALKELYVPIQYREDVPINKQKVSKIGFFSHDAADLKTFERAKAYERALNVARDIGGGDPERMAPPNVASYVEKAFANSCLKMDVISDINVFAKDYPLFEAVNRCASKVPRHTGRIIFLEYKPPNPPKKTIMLVGKGVTYDTGGADIKAGGIMAGMSRDKCGAAAVAGFMKLVEQLKPENTLVVAAMCMVRNSVGSNCYVADEIITSRAGMRVRIGNTDAEGRNAVADTICQMKERVITERLPDPHLFTIATLTGHACLAVGSGYSIVVENAVARAAGCSLRLKQMGDEFGDPFEISTLRPEDFTFHTGKVHGEDLLQCNNLPSSRTPRGHQTPAAFIMMASGLDKCGLKSAIPIKFSHLDIAASSGDVPDTPSGAPIIALAKAHLE